MVQLFVSNYALSELIWASTAITVDALTMFGLPVQIKKQEVLLFRLEKKKPPPSLSLNVSLCLLFVL